MEATQNTVNEACSGLSDLTVRLDTAPVWNRKWYMGFDYCPQCPKRFSQHDMNCIECCPVKRGEVPNVIYKTYS